MIKESAYHELKKGTTIPEYKRVLKNDILEPFEGLDTESYVTGKLLCVSTSKGSLSFAPDQASFEAIAEFLFNHKERLFFCWNAAYDITVLLKTIGESRFDQVNDKDHFCIGPYTIRYVRSKFMYISHKKKGKVRIYDMAQFYGKTSLDYTAKKFLRTGKKYDGPYQDKHFPENMSRSEMIEIVKYCEMDCILTHDLSKLWIEGFYRNFETYPKNYSSPASVAFTVLQCNIDPNVYHDIPKEVQDMGLHAFFGGRFELFKRGHFKNVHHMDINSAYPWSMVLIPDLKDGKWEKITKLSDLSDDTWGVCRIKVTVSEDKICPFPYRMVKGGLVYFPKGTFTTTCTLHELRAAMKHYKVEIHYIQAWQFIGETRSSLSTLIGTMYKTRMENTDEMQRYVYKLMINSIYGKIAQRKPFASSIFNPILAAMITGYTRSLLLDGMAIDKESIIHCATDSIFSENKITIPVTGQKVLGEWSYEKLRSLTQFSNGVYTYIDPYGTTKTQSRGFRLKIETESGDKFLNLNDCKILFNKETRQYYIETKRLQYKTIKRAIIEKNFKEIGVFDIQKKMIDINSDKKRLWPMKLTRFADRQVSFPLNMDWL